MVVAVASVSGVGKIIIVKRNDGGLVEDPSFVFSGAVK